MSDFQLQGEIQIDQSGLQAFEQAAKTSGERAGESLNDGIEKGAKGAGDVLAQALKKGASEAEKTGKKIGDDITDGVESGAAGIPKAVQGNLLKAEKQGKESGKKIGDGLASGVKTEADRQIPRAMQDTLKKTEKAAESSGRITGINYVRGWKVIDGKLTEVMDVQYERAGAKAEGEGQQLGLDFSKGMKQGVLTAGDPGTQELFDKVEQRAPGEGQQVGAEFAKGIKGGVDGNKALFDTVIQQAQRAADRADLIFDSTTLEFKYPNGGIVPQEELNRLTKLDSQLDEAVGSLKNFGTAAQDSSDGVKNAGSGVAEFANQSRILDGVVAGLTATLSGSLLNALGNVRRALTGAVTDFAALDQKIRLANSATGEGEAGYKTLKKAVDEVGVEAAASQGEIADLAIELTRAGLSAEEAAAVMPSVSRAAEGTGTAFGNMAAVVGQSLNVFQLGVEEASRVTDILVQAANASATSVDGLGEALKYAAPAAQSLGVSMEDTVATIGLLANAGIDASQAGTGLRTMLTRLSLAANGASGESLGLARGQEKLADAMKILGAEVIDTNGNLKPLDQTFKALKQSMSQLTEGEQVELATALFGEQGATKFLGVVNQVDADIQGMFDTIRGSEGATAAARKNMEGLKTSFDQLSGSIDVARGTFGKVIGTAIRPLVDALAAAIDIFNKLPGPIKELIAALTLLGGAFVTAKVLVLTFGAAMKNVAFKAAVTEITNLASTIKTSLVRDFNLAKTAVIKFGTALKNVQWGAAITAIKNLASALLTMKWGQVTQQIGNFAKALNLANTGATLKGLKAGTLNLLGLKEAFKFAAKEGGGFAKQSVLVAKEGSKIGPMALKAGAGVKGVGVAAAGAAKGLAGLAIAGGPVTVALAALAAGVVSYNVIMGESRKVTAAVQPEIDAVGKAAKDAGIEFNDLGKQGGPLAEAMRNAGNWTEQFGEKLKQIPIIGGLAKAGWEGFVKVLEYSPFGLAIKGVQGLTTWIKNLYKEASNSQAIIEAGDQMSQFDEITGKTITTAMNLTKELNNLGTTGAPEEIKKVGAEAAKTATLMTGQIQAAKNLETKYRELAAAARENGNEELARGYDVMAQSAGASVKQLEAVRGKLLEAASATDTGKEALEAYSGTVDAATQELIDLQTAASAVDLNLKGAELSLEAVKSTAALENQRFETAKGFYQYQLKQLEGVEGAEGRREAIKKRIDQIERAQHEAAKTALEEQIALEGKILELNQAQARLKADLDLAQANITLKERELELQEAINSGDKDAIDIARSKYELQGSVVGILEDQKGALGDLQQLETSIFNTKSETKREALRTKEATEGWATATGNVNTNLGQTAQNMSNLKGSANGVDQAMGKTVIKSERMADGSIRMWQETQKIVKPMQDSATAAQQLGGFIQTADGQMVTIGGNSKKLATELTNAATGAKGVGDQSDAIGSIGDVNPEELSKNLESAKESADSLSTSAGTLSQDLNNIPSMATPAQNMSGMATDASTIANSGMATTMNNMSSACDGIAGAMGTAATNANNFYTAMKNAAGIPCNKWMGGDVQAGKTYTVNEIGAESFLSRSGRLSRINKPAWGRWRAPSDGVVIPAGMTARLEEQGAFDRSPGRGSGRAAVSGGNDQLPGVIGKLQKSVDELVAKDWNVQVRVRNSEGSSALSVLNKMRT